VSVEHVGNYITALVMNASSTVAYQFQNIAILYLAPNYAAQ